MGGLPTGTVTFLFTDIQESTKLWQSFPRKMKKGLAQHDTLLRTAIETNNGWVFKTVGDAFCAAFETAMDGLNAALSAQLSLNNVAWDLPEPILVRMALHTGEAEERDRDYYGPALNRVARLLHTCHGGQTLLSLVSAELVRDTLPEGVSLKYIGEHRLKDLIRPESVYQLVHPNLSAEFPVLKSLNVYPHNLPVQPTILIGREREIEEIRKMLKDEHGHVVTLTGPGGIGKTRLALQVAAEIIEHFKHGTFFVDLAPVTDPDLVIPVMAQTLRIVESGSLPLLQILKEYLHDKYLLLVLDNFEQVMEAELQIVKLLSECAGLKILVTSREPLHVRGEAIFTVPPLTLPEHDQRKLPPVEQLIQYEAVQLFIERAVATKQEFTVTNDNAPAIAEICIRLDGIPLALELAAARINMLPPRSILRHLGHRLDFLTHGARDLPIRQRTLRTTIEWSYELMDEEGKALFRSLAIFTGGFTLEAAEAVWGTEDGVELAVLDGVELLLDKSLLYQEEQAAGEPRFHILETIREYGLEKLAESGDAETIHIRHTSYFLQLAETAEPKLSSPEVKRWLDKLEIEHDNLRESMHWCTLTRNTESLLRLCGALWRFWQIRGHLTEGRERLRHSLELAGEGPSAIKAKVIYGSCELAYNQSDYEETLRRSKECLSIYRVLGDKLGEAMAHNRIGWAYYQLGHLDLAGENFREGCLLANRSGVQMALGITKMGLGSLKWREGKTEEAERLYEECLEIFTHLGDICLKAIALNNLGLIARQKGEFEKAKSLYIPASVIYEQIGEIVNLRLIFNNLGDICYLLEDFERAVNHYEKLLQLAQQTGDNKFLSAAYAGLAESHLALGSTERALEDAHKSIEVAMKTNQDFELGVGYRIMGEILLSQGKTAEAGEHFRSSIPLLEEIEDQVELEKAKKGLERALSEGTPNL